MDKDELHIVINTLVNSTIAQVITRQHCQTLLHNSRWPRRLHSDDAGPEKMRRADRVSAPLLS